MSTMAYIAECLGGVVDKKGEMVRKNPESTKLGLESGLEYMSRRK